MPEKITSPAGRQVKTLSELQAHIENIWKTPLEQEGFLRKIFGSPEPTVQHELDSIADYQKLMSFYDESPWDRENRERALVDYVSGIFTQTTLGLTLVPRRSWLKKIVRIMSLLYKETPTRWLANKAGETDESDTDYQELLVSSSINRRARDWYERYVASGFVAIRPLVKSGVLTYQTFTPNSFRVLEDAAGDIVKFCYETTVDVDGVTEYAIAVWTNERHYYVLPDGKILPPVNNDGMINPYKIIPAVFASSTEQFYAGGLHDVVEGILRTGFLELLETDDAAFAASGVWKAINFGMKEGEIISPRKLLTVEDVTAGSETQSIPPEIENISGTPHSEMIDGLIDSTYKRAAIAEGVSPAMLESEVRELSGRALKEMKSEILDRRQQDAGIWEEIEAELYEMTAVVCNWHKSTGELKIGGNLIPDRKIFRIDWPEETFSDLDPVKQHELDQKMVEEGYISIVDQYMKINPDVTDEEEAIERIKKNREQFKSLQGGGLKLTALQELMNEKKQNPPNSILAKQNGTEPKLV